MLYMYDDNGEEVDSNNDLDPKQCYLNDALQYAGQSNNTKQACQRVQYLLELGADPDAFCKISGLNALRSSFALGHMDILKVLIGHATDTEKVLDSIGSAENSAFHALQKRPDVIVDIFNHIDPENENDLIGWGHLVDSLTNAYIAWEDPSVNHLKLYKVLLSCKTKKYINSNDDVEIEGVNFNLVDGRDNWQCDIFERMLFDAVEAGALECVKLMLEHKVDVNIVRKELSKRTLLHAACAGGKMKIVGLLLDHGAKYVRVKKGKQGTPLDVAYKNRHADVVRLLLSKGYTSESLQDLHVACLTGDKQKVKELVSSGADVNAKDVYGQLPVALSVCSNNMPLLKFLLGSSKLKKALVCEDHCKYGSDQMCEHHPIIHAVETQNAAMLATLLDWYCGGKPLQKYCSNSHELLVKAVKNSDEKTFMLLLERGVRVTYGPHGSDDVEAIHAAAKLGNLTMLKQLVRQGVDVNYNPSELTVCDSDEDDEYGGYGGYGDGDRPVTDNRPLYLCKDERCIQFLMSAGAAIHSLGAEGEKNNNGGASLFDIFMGLGFENQPKRGGRRKEKISSDKDADPYPPYVKVIESGNVAAMKAYFDARGAELCKNDDVFNLACFNGQFDMVRYLASQNPKWLRTLEELVWMFEKKEEDEFEKYYRFREDHINYKTSHYIKVIHTLFDLGCSFKFTNRVPRARKAIKNPIHEAFTRFLTTTYHTQRFLFCRLLQEFCGRDLVVKADDILESMTLNKVATDDAMIRLLLNCGHKIHTNGGMLSEMENECEDPDESMEFLDVLRDMAQQPLSLKSQSRIQIRRSLFLSPRRRFYNINNHIKKLPLLAGMKEYLSFSGQFEHTYLSKYESGQ